MEAAESEIDAAVDEAYAKGYKAAMLRFAPELAAQKVITAAVQKELETQRKKQRLFWPAIGISVGISFAAGFCLHSLVTR
ncbi:MAG: hypothetical protein FWD36_03230 [Treponema sp.]|nr:hypothetical protein [Treponema sp.]